MTMFITVCAIIVIGIVVAVVMDRIMRTHDTHDTQNDGGCLGCKHLDFWNDGSALCTKNIDGVCIPNGFKYREREEETEE